MHETVDCFERGDRRRNEDREHDEVARPSLAAFAGRDFILEAYREAVRARYRFFSYGDAMLII